jgi:hypothetical protein
MTAKRMRLPGLHLPRLRRSEAVAEGATARTMGQSRARRWLGISRAFIETLLAGLLVGAASLVLVHELVPPAQTAASAESTVAHAFMLAVYDRNTEAQSKLLFELEAAERTLALKTIATYTNMGDPASLTHLGGGTAGPLTVDMYAFEVVLPDGTSQLVPFTVLSGQGRVLPLVPAPATPAPAATQ